MHTRCCCAASCQLSGMSWKQGCVRSEQSCILPPCSSNVSLWLAQNMERVALWPLCD